MGFQGSSIQTRAEDLRAQSQLDEAWWFKIVGTRFKVRWSLWEGDALPETLNHVSRSGWTCNAEPLRVIAPEHLCARKNHFAGPLGTCSNMNFKPQLLVSKRHVNLYSSCGSGGLEICI